MPAKAHIYISDRQIKYGQYGRDENNERKFIPYTHTYAKTPDGNPVPMVHVELPSFEKRKKIHGENVHMFGEDKNGINRDERRAYIQVPAAKVYDARQGRKDDKGKSKMKVIYIDNNEARFNVYFHSEMIGNGRWDKPEKANIDLKELQKLFPASLEQVRNLRSQKAKENEKTNEVQIEKTMEQTRTQVHKRSRSKDERSL